MSGLTDSKLSFLFADFRIMLCLSECFMDQLSSPHLSKFGDETSDHEEDDDCHVEYKHRSHKAE